MHPCGHETTTTTMTGPPEKKLAIQYIRMDTSRPTEPATHSRGQTTMTKTVYEGMELKVKHG